MADGASPTTFELIEEPLWVCLDEITVVSLAGRLRQARLIVRRQLDWLFRLRA